MIIFEWIRWVNFLATGAAGNLVYLNKDSTTLIVGLNGHGKSTLLDALTFALFGKPFRNINKPNLVNSINKKGCVVELEFIIGPKRYKIVRGIAPAIFQVYIDGEMVDQDAVSKDYQKYLEENILKFSYKAFTQIGILGSKSFVPFMRLKAPERRVIIENLLDIEVFSSMNKLAKDTLKSLRDEISANKITLDATNQKIVLQQKYLAEAKKNNQEQIDQLLVEMDTLQDKIDEWRGLANVETAKITAAELEITKLTQGGDPKVLAGLSVKVKIEIDEKNRQLTFYADHDNCPTCKQNIDGKFRIETRDELAKEIVKLNSKKIKIDSVINDVGHQKDIKDESMRIRNRLQQSISVAKDQYDLIVNKIEQLEIKSPISNDMEQISKDLDKELVDLTERRGLLVEDHAYYGTAVSLLNDGGIKTQIVKQYLPVINSFINKYLTAMEFSISFELNEEFEETIKSRHRDNFSYDSFSEGEKQRIDIALLFAWRAVAKLKNSLNTNLLIMDEIFDSSLDGTGMDLILTILGTLPKETNVFIISHRELTSEQFTNTITFQKKNNFSEII